MKIDTWIKNLQYKSCISIDSICPDSSGTIAKQREVKNGLTIVAYIEKYINKTNSTYPQSSR